MSGRDEGTKMPQNVKPKPGQPAPAQKNRPQKARRSRSSDSERGRKREHQHSDRRRRGRSEETRRRRDGTGAERWAPADLLGDTECAVCFCSYDNVFKTPKLLACGHTFCLECLARINVTAPEIKTLSCPVCRVLTELPHGRDLPRLGNNHDIIGRLPADMRRALSVRFQRSKGRLMLKHPLPNAKAAAAINLPVKKPHDPPAAARGADMAAAEEGGSRPTVVDVGRPPSRMRGRMRRLFRSDRCYYAVVASIITITVALMMVGILAFVIIPKVSGPVGPGRPGGNFTGSSSHESSEDFEPNSP